MPRHPDVHPDMIGLVKLPATRTKPIAPPKLSFETVLAKLVRSASGLMLEAAPGMSLTRPARERFPAGEEGDALFAAHLEELGARLRANEPVRPPIAGLPTNSLSSQTFTLGGRRVKYLDLKTAQCAGCRRTLLGPSMEPLRARADYRVARRLPPPIAGRVSDRPVCAACLRAGVKVA